LISALAYAAAVYRPSVNRLDNAVVALIHAQRKPVVGKAARLALRLVGVDVPKTVKVGAALRLPHCTSGGLVIHQDTVIGDRVTILNQATVGIADVWRPSVNVGHAVIGDDVIIGAGARILFRRDRVLTVGEGAVIGANAVLTEDAGAWEVWAGNPARKVGERDHDDVTVSHAEPV
jgi:serine O-acetyltransferase